MIEMFDKFYKGELNLSKLNYGLISLIPKLKEANNIKQFRPICLLGVDYKWFTNVLTRRLTEVAELVISKTQTAFLFGRNILEGVIILHETLHEMKKNKMMWIIMNLDFQKAYDKMSWPFLMEVLEWKTFPIEWREWLGWNEEAGVDEVGSFMPHTRNDKRQRQKSAKASAMALEKGSREEGGVRLTGGPTGFFFFRFL
jgi:hypothetical protein